MVSLRTKGKSLQTGDKKLVKLRKARLLSVNNVGLILAPRSDSITYIPIRISRRQVIALINSRSDLTLISNRYVERNNIPYIVKEILIELDLADKRLVEYRKGKIQIQTIPLEIDLQRIKDKRTFDIIDIRYNEIFLRKNQLLKHNPNINQVAGTVKLRKSKDEGNPEISIKCAKRVRDID